jgi:serine/threonine protein kinase
MTEIRLINKGSYGCIYHTGIKCDGTPESDQYITKIQDNTQDANAKHEIQISQIIKTIPHFEWYFAPILESCDINIAKMDVESIKKCDPVDAAIQRGSTKLSANKIRFLGNTDMESFFIQQMRSSDFLYRWIENFLSLLKRFSILHEYRIVHNDIKGNNIMIQSKTNKPVLIDFGLSLLIPKEPYEIKNVPSFFEQFDYKTILPHPFYPIDLALISYVVQKCKEDPEKLEKTITKEDMAEFELSLQTIWFEKNPIATLSPPPEFLTEWIVYLETPKTWKNLYVELIGYYPTWDIYALECTYLLFYKENKDRISKNREATLLEWIAFLKTQLYCIPNKRLLIHDMYKMIITMIDRQTLPK